MEDVFTAYSQGYDAVLKGGNEDQEETANAQRPMK
jgi:hypothetical protein